ncbi:hypothetical protein MSTE_01990 [Mycobacteroides stephanolepidis]|uniref:Uncharacterized protein n=1 Tax=[Mycobacterium] stephanolepidis TaxID=1520670 RepID=A0A1Z4EWF1_9MYCO|nr:ATP nucleotide 3'-pyrophosphokinase [[Mycobacterium] stephanolepidis]BAX97306.1 hypothetical protein MSTE_01990 [[Mycobacterium] stephanolepidis]
MSLSIAELKKTSVQSIRDLATGLRAKAASMRATKAGVTDLPHKGTWTGVAADNADHEIGTFATATGNAADTYENAAKKVDLAGDEFEGLKQLLDKLENEAAGKFSINEATGEVTPLTKDFNKADRDYIANTLKQLCAAGGQANDDLAAAIHATDGATTPASTSPAGATGAMPVTPNSTTKPDGYLGALRGQAAETADGATKPAAAPIGDTIDYKKVYPKDIPVGDKNVDPSKLGGVGAIPGVRDTASGREPPAKLAPALKPQDVPAFKQMTRETLTKLGVPADQIEAQVNKAVESAQNPHLVRTADVPSASPSEHVSRDFGEQWNKFFANASDGGSKAGDALLQQGKELTGQAGPGAPGVAEAWKNLATDTAKGLYDYTTATPQERLEMLGNEAHRIADNPGGYLGEKLVQGAAGAATGAVGGEAAAGLRGLVGDLTHTPHPEIPGGAGHAGGDAPGHHTPPPVDHPHASSGADQVSGGNDSHGGAAGDHHGPLDDGGGWQSPNGGASLSPEHNAAANQFLEQAREAEPHITQSLRDIVGNTPGSELTGLEHRLKGEDSFKQKFFGSLLEDPQMSLDKHLEGMKDSVRYTMQSPEQLYTANTQRAIDSLIADGYEPVKFKNTWDTPGYQGINSFWRDPSTGQTFEVQFHTPSSFDAKMQTHPLYEQERLPDTAPQRISELQREQKQIFDSVPRPGGSSQISLPPNGGHR